MEKIEIIIIIFLHSQFVTDTQFSIFLSLYLIKEKILKKKVINNIPKMNIIFMTVFLIISIVLNVITLYMNIFIIQPVYIVGIFSIVGFIFGTICGILKNKKCRTNESYK